MSDMPLKEVADKLDDWAQCCFDCDDSEGNEVAEQAASLVRKVDAGEYVPVVHARWVQRPLNVTNDKYGMNKYNMRIECTNCGFVTSSDLTYAICPVCGARMDGKDGSNEAD